MQQFIPFYDLCPEIAEAETGTLTVFRDHPSGLPPGAYSFVEMFCNQANCDCRRVFFWVISSRCDRVAAVVNYGWETASFYGKWLLDDDPKIIAELKGPSLNVSSEQSPLAPAVLNLVSDVLLQDDAYIERIKKHYQIFRKQLAAKRAKKKKKGFKPDSSWVRKK